VSARSKLLAAFEAQLGQVRVTSCSAKPWHSATFAGARHVFEIECDNVAAVDGFAAAISEADIAIPGGFVADVAVTAVLAGTPCRVTVEALTIDA
jgi:hypothetical protein